MADESKQEFLEELGWYFDPRNPDEIRITVKEDKLRINFENADSQAHTVDIVLRKNAESTTN